MTIRIETEDNQKTWQENMAREYGNNNPWTRLLKLLKKLDEQNDNPGVTLGCKRLLKLIKKLEEQNDNPGPPLGENTR